MTGAANTRLKPESWDTVTLMRKTDVVQYLKPRNSGSTAFDVHHQRSNRGSTMRPRNPAIATGNTCQIATWPSVSSGHERP